MARGRARVSREEVEEGDGRQGLFRCGRKRGVMVELGARQWSRKRDVKCLGQPRSQRPRQGQRNWPITASGCVGSPRERESLVRRPECRTIRADPLGTWRTLAELFCLLFRVSVCLEFASRAPSVALYRTVAEPAPPHATFGLLYVVTGRTWYVAACTPHRLLSAMLLLFIVSGRRCKHCCLCQSLGSRSSSL